jgi:hypothetical protein
MDEVQRLQAWLKYARENGANKNDINEITYMLDAELARRRIMQLRGLPKLRDSDKRIAAGVLHGVQLPPYKRAYNIDDFQNKKWGHLFRPSDQRVPAEVFQGDKAPPHEGPFYGDDLQNRKWGHLFRPSDQRVPAEVFQGNQPKPYKRAYNGDDLLISKLPKLTSQQESTPPPLGALARLNPMIVGSRNPLPVKQPEGSIEDSIRARLRKKSDERRPSFF